MISRETNEYGFDKITVEPAEGGRVTIVNFLTGDDNEDKTSDIGLFSSINMHGLGGSNYIRNKEDIDNKINSVNDHVWLNSAEKEALNSFLNEMKN